MRVLSADQNNAIKKLQELRVGALFMEPGTGKTLAALNLIESSDTDFVLFIVPFQTKSNLRNELVKWGFNLKYKIVGVESLSSSDGLYLSLIARLKQVIKPFVVVDESLKIKNKDAKRTQRVINLGKHSYYRLVLNGTPISKNVLDLWSQMEFLSPKILKMKFNQYKNTFVQYVSLCDQEKGYREKIKGFANIEYLYSLIEPYVFESSLKLDINHNEHRLSYCISNLERYAQLKEELIHSISFMGDVQFLSITTMMQECYSLESSKFNEISQIIDNNTIIFCKFVWTKEMLKRKYPQALILTYGKGSLGLNLQKYKRIIFWDKTWDYAQLEQSKRRIFRIGQKEDVDYFYLTGNVGLERMIDRCINKKTTVLDMFKEVSNKEMFINEL